MKKRLIGFAMTLCLLVGSVMNVSAQQVFMDGGSADLPITYDNQSSFCVNIPESIDLNDSDGYLFTADYVYITDEQMLCVFAPADAITMTNEWGANGTVRLYTSSSGNCVAAFLRDQTTSDTPMYAMFDGQEAGHYEGTATFTIQLKAKNQ